MLRFSRLIYRLGKPRTISPECCRRLITLPPLAASNGQNLDPDILSKRLYHMRLESRSQQARSLRGSVILNPHPVARSPHMTPMTNLSAIRNFHSLDSKVHYLDFRYRIKTRLKIHLRIIRRQKMKKHQRIKWRKKYKCLIAKKRLKREIAKEKAFRVELLTIIRRAEQFDPKEYALRKIAEINNVPREKTKEEKLDELKELIRKNRYQVTYVKPKHRTCDTLDISQYQQ